MLGSAIVAFARLVAFILVVVCGIVTFYASIHTININTELNIFITGLLALLIGIVAGPLYCVISFYGLAHYFAISPLGGLLLVAPIFLAWCIMAYNVIAGYLRG